ncbi:MAG: M20/M25/M40 family metallo-hydrolase [Gammaproteobacteria bacterium]|jgi:acetylornithine deacetylase/succinyl-diaminopimelate desuccinylase-like protein|nr:M20/M25/M40 family metallo-hydrolase [Gammaproteobacteria bacterium]MDB4043644.1 M20/M25/M40 family metallo-hydrolase [Gammaproteobacteria bacterium]
MLLKKYFISLITILTISVSADPLDPIQLLSDFVGVDTINPPGNESRAVDFYAKIFEEEGIEYSFGESAPGRGNIWARIKGGDKPALILLQHTDVVPASKDYWETDPMVAQIKDGYLYGRGVIDMKGAGISQLVSFVRLHRDGKKLNRDLVFLATADEEAGGLYGAGWMIENHPEVFEGAGFAINEGGSGMIIDNDKVFSIEVTQKVPVWLRLTATDVPGHGSSPRTTSSVSRIVHALNLVRENPFAPRIIPAVDTYFKSLSLNMSGDDAIAFSDIRGAIKEKDFLSKFQKSSPSYHALTRDTCSLTMLQGSKKINVVPPVAIAEVDCRMLPDRTSDEFIQDFKDLVAPSGVKVDLILAFAPAVSSTESEFFQHIKAITSSLHPGSRVAPAVSTGFTDSHFTRELGIDSYGFNPVLFNQGSFSGVHGNNERVKVSSYLQGTEDLFQIVSSFVID